MNRSTESARTGEFSVCQFFKNDTYEYPLRFVSLEEAMQGFKHYTSSVAAKVGVCVRVIVTDGGDCVNAEWVYGQGLVFPTKEMVEAAQKDPHNTPVPRKSKT